MKNYYKILGTDQIATTHEIKQAHKALLAKYSSGDAHEKGYTAERYIDIAIAYETLVNTEKRTEYDRILNSILPPAQENPKQEKEAVASPEMLIIPKSKNNLLRYGMYIGSLLLILTAITFFQIRKVQKPAAKYVAHSNAASGNSIQQSLKAIQKQDKNRVVQGVKKSQNTTAAVAIVPPVPTITAPKEPVKNNAVKRQEPMPGKLAAMTPAREEQTSVAPSEPETTVPFSGNPQIGTTKKEVLKALGTPNAIVRYDSDNEIWRYSNKNIYFSSNKIISFNDVANRYPGESHYE